MTWTHRFALLLVSLLFVSTGCEKQQPAPTEQGGCVTDTRAGHPPAETAPRSATPSVDATREPLVVFETSHGPITLQLDPVRAPQTTENFLRYVREGHYDGTVFHRVIPDFMIQGGGMTSDMREKRTRSPVRNESGNGLRNQRATIAMARTQDPDSATAQFFINLKDNAFLNAQPGQPGYTVFGVVTDGMGTVDAIARLRTGSRGAHQDVPVELPVIQRAYVVEVR